MSPNECIRRTLRRTRTRGNVVVYITYDNNPVKLTKRRRSLNIRILNVRRTDRTRAGGGGAQLDAAPRRRNVLYCTRAVGTVRRRRSCTRGPLSEPYTRGRCRCGKGKRNRRRGGGGRGRRMRVVGHVQIFPRLYSQVYVDDMKVCFVPISVRRFVFVSNIVGIFLNEAMMVNDR